MYCVFVSIYEAHLYMESHVVSNKFQWPTLFGSVLYNEIKAVLVFLKHLFFINIYMHSRTLWTLMGQFEGVKWNGRSNWSLRMFYFIDGSVITKIHVNFVTVSVGTPQWMLWHNKCEHCRVLFSLFFTTSYMNMFF